jgi:hypothetical protein
MMADRTLEPNEIVKGMEVTFDWSPEKREAVGDTV